MYQIDKQAKGGLYDENITPSYVFDLDRLRERVEAVRAGIKRKSKSVSRGSIKRSGRLL